MVSTVGYAEVYGEVKTIFGRFVESPVTIGEETELIDDLYLDSLRVMEIVAEVEDTLDISFPLNGLAEIRTVKDFVQQIQRI